jgi:hypothetical protein
LVAAAPQQRHLVADARDSGYFGFQRRHARRTLLPVRGSEHRLPVPEQPPTAEADASAAGANPAAHVDAIGAAQADLEAAEASSVSSSITG